MIMNKYDKLFLEQARLGYPNFARKYHKKKQFHDLHERKYLLNQEFVFSEGNVKRLSAINSILQEKSEEAYSQAEKLEKIILTSMENHDAFISDYELGFNLSFFTERKYAHIPGLQGNPFFEYEPIWFLKAGSATESEIDERKDWLFKTDHSEVIHEGHPLNNFHHSYLFHDLIHHTILSYQDIIDIEDIWLEVVLRIQNFQDVS